ncbi:hypothetical protein B7R21_04880 [Subtercola boreus]|uniref:PASTA domain-containing protein n=1 Tax=Subtercola boreus TaxID=120213 RepID=A0A3E0VZ76_9MICO|nr:hypothetical protein [Subtercola boreus]RFA15352.1 hypothetical protein B7R21_04880 [Subtercola boreus]
MTALSFAAQPSLSLRSRRVAVILFALVVALLCVSQSAPAATASASATRIAAPAPAAPAPVTAADAEGAGAAEAADAPLSADAPLFSAAATPLHRDARHRQGATPLAAAGVLQAGLASPTSLAVGLTPRASGTAAGHAVPAGRTVTLLLSINRT